MRVISGSARGKQLESVEGMSTRPTTDRVKESVFNILQFSVYGANVLDLFAGTGQMGIECASRGAGKTVFVDCDKKAIDIIKKNIESARVQDKTEVVLCEFDKYLEKIKGAKFDIIYLDPPYGGKILNKALNLIETFDILATDGIILCESSNDDEVICPDSFMVKKAYKYGAIKITSIKSKR